MTSPLINRLTEVLNYPSACIATLPDLIAEAEYLVLFFPGNADRYPESVDVAVILPELIAAFEGRLRPAVVNIENEAALKQRYPFNVWPSLVFLRSGVQIGNISKVRDWADYIEQINTLLGQAPDFEKAIPSIHI